MRDLPFVDPLSHVPLTREEGGYRSRDGMLYPMRDGVPLFISVDLERHMEEERTGMVNALKTFLRRYPRFYRFLIRAISPACHIGLSPRAFLDRFDAGGLSVNIGSGVHRYAPHIVNVDIFPYRGVDVVADAGALPLPEGSADLVLCEFLLEHVREPEKVVAEIVRVLKPGGRAYITVPFLYPFHASPNDFYRWSAEGLRILLRDADIEIIAPRYGPTSALVAQAATWAAIVCSFGSETLYNGFSIVFTTLLSPLKWLDLLLGLFPVSRHGAGGFYAVIRKRPIS